MWQKWWKGGGRGGVVCSIATDNSVHTRSVPCIYYESYSKIQRTINRTHTHTHTHLYLLLPVGSSSTTEGVRLRLCRKCKVAKYCSAECQKSSQDVSVVQNVKFDVFL